MNILNAVTAAVFLGSWNIFHSLASKHIGSAVGAILVSAVAILTGGIVIFSRYRPAELSITLPGFIFVCLAGAAAFCVDYFTLKTYTAGLDVSIAGPVIIGGSIAVASTLGFMLGEQCSAGKMLAIFLVITGSIILASHRSF